MATTYHGIVKIECLNPECKHVTEDQSEMEMWNDYGDGCLRCQSYENLYTNADGTQTKTLRQADGGMGILYNWVDQTDLAAELQAAFDKFKG